MRDRLTILWYGYRWVALTGLALVAVLAITGAGALLLPKLGAAVPDVYPAAEAPPLDTHARPGAVNEAETALPATGSKPVKVVAEGAGLDASIRGVGLNPDGSAQVPGDAHTVGWYEPLGVPDQVGSDVLVGHVVYKGVDGAFKGLENLTVGAEIQVGFDDGGSRSYKVTEITSHPKGETPLRELYDPNGEERLVLITCGGEYDSVVHHYDHNTVVTAEPS